MVKPTAYFTLNLLLPVAIAVGLSSPVLAAQWVDANKGFSVDLGSIRRVSQGVYQYRSRIDLLKTPEILYRNSYFYRRVDCANQRQADLIRHLGSKGDGRMHINWEASIADNLQSASKLPLNQQVPAYRMFTLVCDRVQQNFQRGVIPPDLEPDWDLEPETYIEADEKIPRWP